MGMTRIAARATTPTITANAMGALRALGRLILPSSIRKSELCLSSARFCKVDCTSNTSPARRRVSSSPGDSRSSIPSKRLNANNLSLKRDIKPALPIRTPFNLEAGVMATSAICWPSAESGWLASTACSVVWSVPPKTRAYSRKFCCVSLVVIRSPSRNCTSGKGLMNTPLPRWIVSTFMFSPERMIA